MFTDDMNTIILSSATFLGAPSYGGVRTWVEGSQTRGDRALAGASNLLGYKEYIHALLTTDPCIKLMGVGRDNILANQNVLNESLGKGKVICSCYVKYPYSQESFRLGYACLHNFTFADA